MQPIFPARESSASDIPAGDEKTAHLFLQCNYGDGQATAFIFHSLTRWSKLRRIEHCVRWAELHVYAIQISMRLPPVVFFSACRCTFWHFCVSLWFKSYIFLFFQALDILFCFLHILYKFRNNLCIMHKFAISAAICSSFNRSCFY